MGTIDYDSRLDYPSFYTRYLGDLKPEGADTLVAKCPFHDDTKPSLAIKKDTGEFVCRTCDKRGNAWTLLDHLGKSKDEAKEIMRAAAGIVDLKTRRRARLTVEEYARQKKLDVDFLKSVGVKNTTSGITIPYTNSAGEVTASRQRFIGGAGPKFSWNRGAKIIPYGAWRIEQHVKPAGEVIFVEGESDTHTCWSHGIENVIGIPGANMFKREWAPGFADLDVIIHQEPGEGGETFVRKITEELARARHAGRVRVFTMRGHKDPSDAHIANPETWLDVWRASLETAHEVDITTLAVDVSGVLPGAPVALTIPDDYIVSQSGVKRVGKEGEYITVCPVPLLISKRLRSIDTGEEKIELAYQRDGSWHSITTKRSVVFTSRGITELADRGLPVTSENAREIVRYLGALESSNLDTLDVARSVERLGWVGSRKFIPGLCTDIVLDVPQGSEGTADAYREEGELAEWRAVAAPIIDGFPFARFMLAASFAAPMLKLLRQRVFIIHFWGASRGGKTAAMKLALSAWGDPEALMATFNTTKVGMERMAGFYNDLPLGVDERQVIGKDQGLAEGLVYLLGAGKGKVRGNKSGGLQATHTWRTIALTTGEEPLSRSSTHTGVKTRALEIYGQPVNDERTARDLHRVIGRNYGHAGPAFVRALLGHLDNAGDIDADHDVIHAALEEDAPDHMVAHTAAVAVVCLADWYMRRWVMGDDDAAPWDSLELGRTILAAVETEADSDYAGRADEWIRNWLSVNRDRFTDKPDRDPWGFIEGVEDGPQVWWILPSVLETAMDIAGYSTRRVLSDLAGEGAIVLDDSDGRKRHTKRQTWQGIRQRMIGYKLDSGPVGPTGPANQSERWDLNY